VTRTLVASLLVAVAGVTTLTLATDGWRAFTAEAARRLHVAEHPSAVPEVRLEDQDGRRFRLSDLRPGPVLIDFIYTSCPTLCSTLGSSFQRLQARLRDLDGTALHLVSISFDTARDDPARLAAYAARFEGDPRYWTLARVDDPADLAPLLEAFGVKVIPDSLFGFEHNAAIHLVDRRGRLSRIVDYDAPEAAWAAAQEAG
jgi:protein SCO1/2